jgi:hypothetical protein
MNTEPTTPAPSTATIVPQTIPVLESAMRTGEDDEPEMTIGDRHAGDTIPDPDGDGVLTPDEAERLLGGEEDMEQDGQKPNV